MTGPPVGSSTSKDHPKTQLLHAFAREAAHGGYVVCWADVSGISPEPVHLEEEIHRALSVGGARRLLVVDGLEQIGALEGWLRERILPGLDAGVLVALAGRNALDDRWRLDPGWQAVLEVCELAPFTEDEVGEYLRRRTARATSAAAVHAETAGLPLAVALVADLAGSPGAPAQPLAADGDVVHRLVGRFLDEVTDPEQERALMACVLTRHMTEDLLACMLEVPSATRTYRWLAGLSFIEQSAAGLVPHELVRRILASHFQAHAKRQTMALLYRAVSHYRERARTDAFWEEPSSFYGSQYLLSQFHRGMHGEAYLATMAVSPAEDAHWPLIEEVIRHHEGERAVERAKAWRKTPGQWLVVTDETRACRGFIHMVALERLSSAARASDPATEVLSRHLGAGRSSGPEGPTWLGRSWMCRDVYQDVSLVQTWIFHHLIDRIMGRPQPAGVYICVRDPERWLALQSDVPPRVLEDVSFEVEWGRFGYLGIDTRNLDVRAWYRAHLELPCRVLEQLLGGDAGDAAGTVGTAADTAGPAAVDLVTPRGRARALKATLKALHEPARLFESPLLDLQLVAARAKGDAPAHRVAALVEVLREEAVRLGAGPRDAHLPEVLERVYFRPDVKQAVAASEMGMSYSTFRRHAGHAVERLAEAIWQREAALACDLTRMDAKRDAPA